MRKRTLKTAIFVDPFGCMSLTPEEEIEKHVDYYSGEYGPFDGKVKLNWYRIHHMGELKPRTELVLFDYGGMSMGNGLMEDNSRRVAQWAIDNPNSLVVVVSGFTYDHAM